jgi:hypothetical protein
VDDKYTLGKHTSANASVVSRNKIDVLWLYFIFLSLRPFEFHGKEVWNSHYLDLGIWSGQTHSQRNHASAITSVEILNPAIWRTWVSHTKDNASAGASVEIDNLAIWISLVSDTKQNASTGASVWVMSWWGLFLEILEEFWEIRWTITTLALRERRFLIVWCQFVEKKLFLMVSFTVAPPLELERVPWMLW